MAMLIKNSISNSISTSIYVSGISTSFYLNMNFLIAAANHNGDFFKEINKCLEEGLIVNYKCFMF